MVFVLWRELHLHFSQSRSRGISDGGLCSLRVLCFAVKCAFEFISCFESACLLGRALLRVDAAVAAPPHHGRRMLGGGLRRNPSWECSQPRKTEDQATTGEGTASSTLNASAPHRKFSFSIAPSPPPTSIYVNSGMCMIFFITKMVQI